MTIRIARLGDIVEDLRSGFACGVDDPDGVIQFRMNNVERDGALNWTKTRRVPQALMKSGHTLQPEDILLNATNSPDLVGKTALFLGADEPITFSNHFFRLRTRAKAANPAYIARWLRRQFELGSFKAMCRSWVNQASITRDQVLNLEVPLPPLDQQKRIAAILDKADQLRQRRRHAIALLDSLTQSIFLEMFGDPVSNARKFSLVPLSSLIDSMDRLNYGVVQPGDTVEGGGVPLIRVSDLRGGNVDRSDLKHIDPSISKKHSKSVLSGREILISCVGSIGEIALASDADRGSNIARAVARVPLRSDVSREFVATYLRTGAVQSYFTKELRTVSQPTLNIKQISETLIPLVDSNETKEFERRLKHYRKLKRAQNLQLEKTEAMFSSLQHRAFAVQL